MRTFYLTPALSYEVPERGKERAKYGMILFGE
jgi:hypothetical protein